MLQSEVQAVTITKTIRKGKRLLAPLMKFNNVRIKQDFDTPPGKRLVAAGSMEQKRLQLWFEKPA
ncbi:hypothetical protein Peur_070486 [Populus x canadensis]